TMSEIPPFSRYAISNVPTIDGAQPRNWNYAFDVVVDPVSKSHTLQLRPLKTSLRSVNCPKPLPMLGDTEELTLLAPPNFLVLTAQENQGPVSETIEAVFMLRDFPELGPPVTSTSVSVTLPAKTKNPTQGATKTQLVPRNEKCPCGSGRKYKHCCG